MINLANADFKQGNNYKFPVSETSEFHDFKASVLAEIQALKILELKLHEEIIELREQNDVKTKKLELLERKLTCLDEESSLLKQHKRQAGGGVAFTVYLSHGVHNLTQDQPIVYDKVLLNMGGAYNTKTGMFTAPVGGVYLFSYSVGAKSVPGVHLSQYDVFTRLVVDNVHQVSAVAESTGTYDDEQGSTTAILFVEQGSKVWTRHELRGGNNLYSTNDERVTSFTGTLLFEGDSPVNSAIIG